MSWLGAGIGCWIGNSIGGPLGGIIGAVIGGWLSSGNDDESVRNGAGRSRGGGTRSRSGGSGAPQGENPQKELIFLGAAAAMLAKMAKADGRVSREEIASADAAFARLGISGEKRDYCIKVFREAKDDEHTIFEYAAAFSDAQPDYDMRVLFYDILWDLAVSDGVLSQEEKSVLASLPVYLHISPVLFSAQYSRRSAGAHHGGSGRGGQSRSSGRRSTSRVDPLVEAYAVLGCSPSATDDEIKRAYRDKAKKYHPDEMVAKGLPPELIQKANDEMARVNAAYDLIKKSRKG